MPPSKTTARTNQTPNHATITPATTNTSGSSSSSSIVMECVDGPMLPQLHHFSSKKSNLPPRATTSLVPIITPPAAATSTTTSINHTTNTNNASSFNDNADVLDNDTTNNDNYNNEMQQYLLIPNPQQIVVRSMHHGRRVCALVPTASSCRDDEDGNAEDVVAIHAVALAWVPLVAVGGDENGNDNDDNDDDDDEDYDDNKEGKETMKGEWVILAGCSNGSIQEWTVASLALASSSSSSSSRVDNGGGGGSRGPRRLFHLKCGSGAAADTNNCIIHLTSPAALEEDTARVLASSSLAGGGGGSVVYALIEGDESKNSKTKSKSKSKSKLVRCVIPPYFHESSRRDSSKRMMSASSNLSVTPLVSVKHASSKLTNEELTKLQKQFICLPKKDVVFGLLAAYRPQSPEEAEDDDDGNHNGTGMEYVTEGGGQIMDGGGGNGAKGDVFLVICASGGFVIYRDAVTFKSVDNNNNDGDDNDNDEEKEEEEEKNDKDVIGTPSMVHFTRSMQSTKLCARSKESCAFSSLAISPDVKDLALGRINGRIEVLDNVFFHVASFLDKLNTMTVLRNAKGEDANGSSSILWSEKLQHPDVVTVRRTVHWHAHPVRALTFLTAFGTRQKGGGGGGSIASTRALPSSSSTITKSLISGGEESVLVTWQLDRNFHRPSHFIARVGQGGIIHALCCQYTGKIIVACTDNSIQCFSGSNYERNWVEQGLASAPVHEDEGEGGGDGLNGDKKQQGPAKGPIIMTKDPITNFPMLTNLPGAPGMVHWYDPKSASVVGTLEVAPYNRVSRRDPLNDPHIPAPAVTHLALGQNGKDLVTVDISWTENTSLGSEYGLIGPQGTVTEMNVCTNIKFWSYVDSHKGGKADQRKRRNGELPMTYELVSSMAAPHGRDGEICALAISPDGSTACTLSQEEDAFRVWVKNTTSSTAEVGSTLWKCLYKVKTPSGYANLLSQKGSQSTGEQLVSFSSDGTVLSVSYGPYITLWDHSNATLLTSVTLDECATAGRPSEDIQQVHFLTKNDDAMLLSTATQIGIKSPFGGGNNRSYLGEDEWSFDADCFGKKAHISAMVPVQDFGDVDGLFAVSVALDFGTRSIVSIINRKEGKAVCAEGTNDPLQWEINGEVQSLCVNKCSGSNVQLLAITKDCQMFSLRCGVDEQGTPTFEKQPLSSMRAQAPVLKIARDTSQTTASVKKRKIAIGGVSRGSKAARDFTGFEFPALSGKFTSAFIAKNLGRGNN